MPDERVTRRVVCGADECVMRQRGGLLFFAFLFAFFTFGTSSKGSYNFIHERLGPLKAPPTKSFYLFSHSPDKHAAEDAHPQSLAHAATSTHTRCAVFLAAIIRRYPTSSTTAHHRACRHTKTPRGTHTHTHEHDDGSHDESDEAVGH